MKAKDVITARKEQVMVELDGVAAQSGVMATPAEVLAEKLQRARGMTPIESYVEARKMLAATAH